MTFQTLLLGSAMAMGLTAAQAGDHHGTTHHDSNTAGTGWYLGLEAGANWLDDSDVDGQIGATDFPNWFDLEFDTGFAGFGAVGYRWANNWRLEFELGYRQNDVDCIYSVQGGLPCATGVNHGGDIWELSQMLNILYDIPLGHRFNFSVGGGLGGVLVNAEDAYGFHDDDYVFAGQALAQLGYAATSRLNVVLGYRYLAADDPDLSNLTYFSNSGIPGAVRPALQRKYDLASFDKEEHTLTLGLRFDLQDQGCCVAPPPPPPPPPADVPPPSEFIVFFGFNKSNLTADAQRVIAEAAAAAAQMKADVVQVIGHADTVGSPGYNMNLSQRRAMVVRHELVRLGVPEDRIQTSGRGEADPMVPTGDNVKEPQNRRAVIVIRLATN